MVRYTGITAAWRGVRLSVPGEQAGESIRRWQGSVSLSLWHLPAAELAGEPGQRLWGPPPAQNGEETPQETCSAPASPSGGQHPSRDCSWMTQTKNHARGSVSSKKSRVSTQH